MKKIKEFIEKYRILFFISLIINIYFLITEIFNFVSTKAALSMFTIVLYVSTIVYMSLMELFELLKKPKQYAYTFTIYFLLVNALVLPITVLLGNLIDSISPIYTVSRFVGSHITIAVIIYFVYLLFKFIKPIFKSARAKRKEDDYARASFFGDIISALLTLITSFFGVAIIAVMPYLEAMPFYDIRSVPFIVSGIVVWALTIVFLIKCVIGKRKLNKKEVVEQPE